MMELIEKLRFKADGVGMLVETVLHLDKEVKEMHVKMEKKDKMLAGVNASRASACRELVVARCEVTRMEKWVAHCKRDYKRGEEYTKSVLRERALYRGEDRRLEARLAGKISEGIDKGTRVDREMCEWGSARTQTDVALSQEVASTGVQTDGVLTPSYADVAARGAGGGPGEVCAVWWGLMSGGAVCVGSMMFCLLLLCYCGYCIRNFSLCLYTLG